jgi:hypothetical protein
MRIDVRDAPSKHVRLLWSETVLRAGLPRLEGRHRGASPLISHYVGASGLRIGESSSAKKTFVESEELPDADGV